jgi:hypothetical protein
MLLSLPLLLLLLGSATAQVAPQPPIWPSPVYDELEALMMQYDGYRALGFFDGVATCSFSSSRDPGRRTAAEWIRTAYHDMATANVAAGTGGLDGSLQFETDREENVGSGITSSFGFFQNFFNARVSLADLIALGVHTATRSCRGPFVPYRANRIDAISAGPLGVPQAGENLTTLTQRFEQAGFNTEDMIGLVACGHTLGAVHSVDFPNIVPNGTRLNNAGDFDSTAAAFDNKVVVEYLDSNSSDPLLIGPPATNSDARVFSADGNVTMEAMADPAEFQDRCKALFERMINTVPREVNLTDPILPYEVKPVEVHLTVASGTLLNFAGDIRVRTTVRPASEISKVELLYVDRDGSTSGCEEETGCTVLAPETLLQGGSTSSLDENFQFYTFSTNISSSSGVSSYTVRITLVNGTTEIHDNGGERFTVPNLIFFQPSASCNTPFTNVSIPLNSTIVAAVHNSRTTIALGNPILKVVARRPVTGLIVPELFRFDVVMEPSVSEEVPVPKEYVWYQGSYTLDIFGFEGATFDVVSGEGSDMVMDPFREPGFMQPC